jgi:hypothetical protein
VTGLPLAWGAVGDEHTRAWPVDARVPGPVLAMTRGVCRLVVTRRGPVSALRSRLLAWGDLVMMRRQLLNLKGLAERDARRSGAD